MKIGIDARLWSETGVGRYIRNLVDQLQEIDKKNQYVLFASDKDREKLSGEEFFTKDNWKIIYTTIHWHTLTEQVAFPGMLLKENLDLVHFPYFSLPIFYNRPFVVTIHDLINNHYPTGKASTLPLHLYYAKQLAYQFVIQQAAKKAKKIITVSNATKKEIIDHLHIQDTKIAVTYEGLDEEVANTKHKKISLTNDFITGKAPYFLYVGNAYPHKNLERLIDAFFFLHSSKHDIKLVLVGKEDYFYQRLKEKVRMLHLENSIFFTGFILDEELSYYYQHAIATVIPSLMEGFGLPALEAMANNCAVIASDIPSLREVCEQSALYADPLKSTVLSEQMLTIYSDQHTRMELIKKGREQIKKFSWKRLAEQTLHVYNSL